MILINPAYSFVRFDAFVPYVLPVALTTDIKFQFIVSGTVSEMNAVMGSDNILNVVNSTGTINSDATMLANLLGNYEATELFLQAHRLSPTRVLLYWPHGLPGITALAIEMCFRLVAKINGNFYVSNKFQLVELDKYTSAVEYSCDEDAYQFIYCIEDVTNKIRLPIFISRPQFQDDESLYVGSEGVYRITKSVTRKEYEGRTDYFPVDLHEKIKNLLSHDNVNIESENYTGGIRKNGNYDIEWPEQECDVGMGKFKVFATPYDVRNSNCEECKTYDCDVMVIDVTVIDNETQGGGYWSYIAEWDYPGDDPETVTVEFSTDNGVTWQLVPNGVRVGPFNLIYDIGGETPQDHKIRITPLCSNGIPGEAGGANYFHNPDCIDFTDEVTSTTITLSWDLVPGQSIHITGYTNSDGTGIFWDQTVTDYSSASHSGLTPGTIYYTRLQPAGRTEPCDLISITTSA